MQWGFLSGANTRIRTGDLILTKDVLCRLSHISKLLTVIYYIIINLFCQGKIEIKQVILNCVFANGQIVCSYSRYARLYCSFRYGCYNGATTDVYEHTAVEMQLNQNKVTNAEQIAMLFGLSPDVLSGRADDRTYINSIRTAVLPVVSAFEMALNRALLLEKEKRSKYFVIDTSELLKADILTRYQAYQIGLAANFLQPDEIRFKENLAPLGLDFIKLGLNDVLYDPTTKQIYTPNTDSHAKIDDAGLQNGGAIKSVTVSEDGTVTTVYKPQAKTKYAPSPQRNHSAIQVKPKTYAKLCGEFNTIYPGSKKGESGYISKGKYRYKAESDGEGGIIIRKKWRQN